MSTNRIARYARRAAYLLTLLTGSGLVTAAAIRSAWPETGATAVTAAYEIALGGTALIAVALVVGRLASPQPSTDAVAVPHVVASPGPAIAGPVSTGHAPQPRPTLTDRRRAGITAGR